MTLLPTSVWEDVATKTDLELHDALLKLQINEVHNDLKTEIADLRAELKGDIADLRAELKGDIADVRLEIAELRTEMHQMFRKNYMVMISAIFAINSLFFAATKFWG
jgi:predicted  nucleic acid-binding Zn-ribbon protein